MTRPTSGPPSSHGDFTELRAEDLIAFNNLLSGILRAGLPLESGLRAVAADWPGRTGSLIRQLTDRLQQGQNLETALAQLSTTLPGEYVALLKAGQQSGRLPEMLDDLTRLARLRQESRRLAVVSMIYPLIVAVVATLLSLFVLTQIVPVMLDTMIDSRALIPGWLTFVGQISTQIKGLFKPEMWVFVIAGSLLLISLLGIRFGRFAECHAERLPFLGKAWSDSRMAYWTDLMAVLIEHGTPEADAVELAARVGGQRQMIEKMQSLTALLRAGHQPSIEDWKASGVPVLGAWAVTWRGPSGDRVASLRLIAQNYNRLARDRMLLSTSLLPVLCLVVIGGLFTLMYGLMMFLPLTSLYRSLS